MNIYFIGMMLSFIIYLLIGFLISRKVKMLMTFMLLDEMLQLC